MRSGGQAARDRSPSPTGRIRILPSEGRNASSEVTPASETPSSAGAVDEPPAEVSGDEFGDGNDEVGKRRRRQALGPAPGFHDAVGVTTSGWTSECVSSRSGPWTWTTALTTPGDQPARQAVDDGDVPAPDRRHIDDVPFDQLDAVVLGQHAGPGQRAVVVGGEPVSGQEH